MRATITDEVARAITGEVNKFKLGALIEPSFLRRSVSLRQPRTVDAAETRADAVVSLCLQANPSGDLQCRFNADQPKPSRHYTKQIESITLLTREDAARLWSSQQGLVTLT
jgi:hypothetical protein